MSEKTLDVSWETIIKFFIASFILYVIYLARDIAVWFFFALVISILLQPAVYFLRKIYIPKIINNTAIELTSQIITLDANVNLKSPQDPAKLIAKYSALIDPSILWSIEIIDIYQTRCTFRVSYYNCDHKNAKKIHLKTFNLI